MGYNMSALEAAELARLGCKVERATSNITTGEELFTVAGGNCLVTMFVGEVTTDIENISVDLTIVADPTTGTSTTMGAILVIDDDVPGTLYTLEGLAADTIQLGGTGSVEGAEQEIVVAPGAIEATIAGGAHTGSIKFTLWYVPLETGAYIVAA